MLRNLLKYRLISRNSLGGQIMSLLGVALLSTLILFSLSVFFFVNRVENTAWRGRQSEAARNAAGTVSAFIKRVEDTITLVSIVESDQLANDPDELNALIKAIPALLEIVRTDSSGHVFVSASRDKDVLANLITIPQSQWFLVARRGHIFIGDVQVSATNAPFLIMSVPSADQGTVAARVRMDVLWEVVQDIRFGESGRAYVITQDGRMIAHTDSEIVTNNTTIREQPEFTAMLSAPNNEWSGTYTNFQGERVVGYSHPIPGTDWLIVTELPLREAFSATWNAVYVLGAEAFLLMTLVSWMVARYLSVLVVKPIEQLKSGTDRIGQGDLDHRIGMIRNDEIGQLASAFDTMTARLHERDAQVAAQTKALQISEERYRLLADHANDVIWLRDMDLNTIYISPAVQKLRGYTVEEALSQNISQILTPESAELSLQFLAKILREAESASAEQLISESRTLELEVYRKDGSTVWTESQMSFLVGEQGKPVNILGITRDITDRKRAANELHRLNAELEDRVTERTLELTTEINERQRAETALRESEERYALAVRGTNDGLWDWNLTRNEIYYSPRWKAMLGFSEDEIGNHPDEWFKRIQPDQRENVRKELASHIQGITPSFEIEYLMQHADGNYLWVLSRGLAVRDSKGNACRITGSQTDISARKLVEESITYGALHDSLTGLPNRALFMDRLTQILEHTKRHPDDLFAVLFIDLDRFKVVNDSLGHAVGDQLLIATAGRLQHSLRPEDTVSRLGGDEFGILLTDVKDVSEAIRVAERIQTRMRETTMLGSVHRSSTASIGITVFNGNYTDPLEMLRDADSAMYRAKALGGDRYQIFDPDMYLKARALLELEADLKQAVENQEWQVYYQPVVSLTSGEIAGVEALVRWIHPRHGIIQPDEFIPLAEETGLILPIGAYVLEAACTQARIWRDAGHSKLWVSVNLSARQFQDRDLVKKIRQIMRESRLPDNGLHLEVTESIAMKDLEYSARLLRELNELGIRLSLDDFGNGYSSFGYLKFFPLNVLKIDRSFIQDLDTDKNSEAITTAIISLGHLLNLEVVAEGVETENQFAFLKAQFCDKAQGFLFCRPLPAEDIGAMLKSKVPYSIQKTMNELAGGSLSR